MVSLVQDMYDGVKEMIKRPLKLLEYASILNQVSLHLWSDLLVELEFFNDQVEIVEESLFDIFSNVVVQSGLDMVRLVRFLNLLDPHVQRVELFFNQIIKVVGGIEDTVD